ncbi:MAG TPA: hypothetical protein VL359_18125, partial [bacterium]|nr:hypothetical protein [bacterium]
MPGLQRVPSLITFDVYGTLMDVREGSRLAFARILAACGGQHVDPLEFWEAWEQANIRRYWEPYQGYREICRASLEETLAAYRLRGDGALIRHYFDAFRGFRRFPDVDPALEAL